MMAHTVFSSLRADLRGLPDTDLRGRVQSLGGLELRAAGLGAEARLGAHVEVAGRIRGEIVAVDRGTASVLPFGTWDGIAVSDEVRLLRTDGALYPDPAWVGRTLDAFGAPLDGAALPQGPTAYPARATPPDAFQRRPTGAKLESGIKAVDVFVPLCRGQRLGVFAGSGVGKSTLMAMFARQIDADVIVIGLVGERGREVQDFITRDLGPEGMARTVLVVATSDQPPLTRRQAAWTATAVAEYLRDQGRQVLLMIDSVTRFAMAQREIGLSAGEPPTTRGYTPTVFAELPRLLERSGPGRANAGQGDITAIYTVLVDGDDHNEPIADTARGILDGHLILDRRIAETGRYPAIDVAKSVSRSLPHCHTAAERAIMTAARRALAAAAEVEDLVRIGAYRSGSDLETDAAIRFAGLAEDFLKQGRTDRQGSEISFATLYGLLTESGLPLSPEQLAAG
jgi:flagellum-specific ATP synthase